jgi:hypothetical protein
MVYSLHFGRWNEMLGIEPCEEWQTIVIARGFAFPEAISMAKWRRLLRHEEKPPRNDATLAFCRKFYHCIFFLSSLIALS